MVMVGFLKKSPCRRRWRALSFWSPCRRHRFMEQSLAWRFNKSIHLRNALLYNHWILTAEFLETEPYTRPFIYATHHIRLQLGIQISYNLGKQARYHVWSYCCRTFGVSSSLLYRLLLSHDAYPQYIVKPIYNRCKLLIP